MLAFNREQVDFLLNNLYNHFNQEEFENGYGEFTYWKGKTNLRKLKEAFNLAFGEYPKVLNEEYIKIDGEITGGAILAKFKIYPTTNGFRQDSATEPWYVYYRFILSENIYNCRQIEEYELAKYMSRR